MPLLRPPAAPATPGPSSRALRQRRRRLRALLTSLVLGVVFGALAPLMRDAWHDTTTIAVGAGLTAFAGTWLLIRIGFEPLQRKVEEREDALRTETARQEFGMQLTRALERTRNEPDVLRIATRAVETIDTGLPAEVLIADSSLAHLRRQAATEVQSPGCDCRVVSPWDCPAMSSSQTQTFPDSRALDACQQLRDRAAEVGHPLAATCLPLASRGQVLGVLHVAAPVDRPIVADERSLLATIASRTGATMGATRAFAKSQLQASTDPLTGLLNRRSFEERAATVLDGAELYALLMIDLDKFKTLNDLHGHSTGDRALRRFSDILQAVARDTDLPAAPLVARVGGEEFLLLLPRAGAVTGSTVAEDLRTALSTTDRGVEPAFTVSVGVAEGMHLDDLARTIGAADRALFAAKAAGRDRVVVAATGRIAEQVPQPRADTAER